MWGTKIQQAPRPTAGLRRPAGATVADPAGERPGAGGVPTADLVARARRLRAAEVIFVADPSFDDPARRREILAAWPAADAEALLGREQEFHLFRQMHYLRYRADRLRRRIDPKRPRAARLDRVERLLARAEAVRDRIIRANLGLVAAAARRFVAPSRDVQDLIGEGYLPLIKAVDRFDYTRGLRFSTYATRAVANHLARLSKVEWRHRGWLVSDGEEFCLAATDHRADEPGQTRAAGQARAVVERLLGRLDERERRVLVGRFGLGGRGEQTLAQLGVLLGLSKERVRQIEHAARQKLGRLALAERCESLPA